VPLPDGTLVSHSEGIAVGEWKRAHGIALARISALMAQGEDIVLDDANCFRWLRDMYTQFASEDGYAAELA